MEQDKSQNKLQFVAFFPFFLKQIKDPPQKNNTRFFQKYQI